MRNNEDVKGYLDESFQKIMMKTQMDEEHLKATMVFMYESVEDSMINIAKKNKDLIKQKKDIDIQIAANDIALEQLEWIEKTWKMKIGEMT